MVCERRLSRRVRVGHHGVAGKALVMESTSARVRPVAVPEDLSDLDGPPLRGVVELPRHVRWSAFDAPSATESLAPPCG